MPSVACPTCGATDWFAIKTDYSRDLKESFTQCSECHRHGKAKEAYNGDFGQADVYWPGCSHTNPNITDRMGRPIELTSRSQKARVMREQNISEAADRVRGAPWTGGKR